MTEKEIPPTPAYLARLNFTNSVECPMCSSTQGAVTDSRPTIDGRIRRRRMCGQCSFRFHTLEEQEDIVLTMDKPHPDTETLQNLRLLYHQFLVLIGER